MYKGIFEKYRSQCEVVFWAHNSARYDSQLKMEAILKHHEAFNHPSGPLDFVRNSGAFLQIKTVGHQLTQV